MFTELLQHLLNNKSTLNLHPPFHDPLLLTELKIEYDNPFFMNFKDLFDIKFSNERGFAFLAPRTVLEAVRMYSDLCPAKRFQILNVQNGG